MAQHTGNQKQRGLLESLWKAFWIRFRLPGVGRVPVNALGVAALGALGFVNTGFWLLGAGVELAYLLFIVTRPSFHNYLDAQSLNSFLSLADETAEANRRQLVEKLDKASQARLAALEDRCQQVLKRQEASNNPSGRFDNTREALQKLAWLFLKLLTARRELALLNESGNSQELAADIDKLQQAIDSGTLAPGVEQSKRETLEICKRRHENLKRAESSVAEIESNLERIEAQVDLVYEEALTRTHGTTNSTADLAFAKYLLDDSLFGQDADAVKRLDKTYGTLLESYSDDGYGDRNRPDSAASDLDKHDDD